MKTLSQTRTIIFMAFLFGNLASANTVKSVFKTDSILPAELQTKVLEFAESNCSEKIEAFGLEEVTTTSNTYPSIKIEPTYEQVHTMEYLTELRSRYHNEQHPTWTKIFVKSTTYDFFSEKFTLVILCFEDSGR